MTKILFDEKYSPTLFLSDKVFDFVQWLIVYLINAIANLIPSVLHKLKLLRNYPLSFFQYSPRSVRISNHKRLLCCLPRYLVMFLVFPASLNSPSKFCLTHRTKLLAVHLAGFSAHLRTRKLRLMSSLYKDLSLIHI